MRASDFLRTAHEAVTRVMVAHLLNSIYCSEKHKKIGEILLHWELEVIPMYIVPSYFVSVGLAGLYLQWWRAYDVL